MNNDQLQSIMALVSNYALSVASGLDTDEECEAHRQALESAISAIAAPGVAQGWVMVPVEPDDLRLKAGVRAFQTAYSDADPLSDWRACYRAFIAPSPTAEQPTPPATSVDEAARSLAKWLNERPNRPINLSDVAMLVDHVQMEDASDDRAWNAE